MVVLGAQGSMELQIGSFEDRKGIEAGRENIDENNKCIRCGPRIHIVPPAK